MSAALSPGVCQLFAQRVAGSCASIIANVVMVIDIETAFSFCVW